MVAARLKKFRKPKSQVPGDIFPDLVSKFADILAVPLTYIFNFSLSSLSWPKLWKSETVSIIPKNTSPTGISELRNLSCTPLFSKVLESFVLDELKKGVSLSMRQYGGIKGCSTEHFLLETWNQIMSSLEGNCAASLVSIDFEKAFNRMNHLECLKALRSLGATERSVNWTAAFLHDRTMSVKIREARSTPRKVPGGSPQGSILGNFLFCVTTNCFAELPSPNIASTQTLPPSREIAGNVDACDSPARILNGALASSTPKARGQFISFRPPKCLANLTGDFMSDEDEEFEYFRIRNANPLDSSNESSDESIRIQDSTCSRELQSMVYIDDFNTIEQISLDCAMAHYTTGKTQVRVKANKSEVQFGRVKELADTVGMRVNGKKTQLLCIHASRFKKMASYIDTLDGPTIESSESLKILGFYFNEVPDAVHHVNEVINKFYGKLWMLRFLKKSGMEKMDLMRVYCTFIRAAAEYCSIVYHSLIPQYMSDRLEMVQKQAIRIIFGRGNKYEEMIMDGSLERLEERRRSNCLKFALKNYNSGRFGSKWFPQNTNTRDARATTRRMFVENVNRTERSRNNPLQYMIRLLNEHMSKEQTESNVN